MEEGSSHSVGSVLIVGGGTAGYLTALALRRERPDIEVTLIESSRIPVIGVGEATTTLMPPFLHERLGLDIVDLYQRVRPTWKLGIRFEWGDPAERGFDYPFGATAHLDAFKHDGNLDQQSVAALLMQADRAPVVREEDGEVVSLLPQMKWAYHLNNRPFVEFLSEQAKALGVYHVDAEVKDAPTSDNGEELDHVLLGDGRALRADLYIDASGFRSLLLGDALSSEFIDYASSLFCDRAVVGEVPPTGTVQPYTTAETMEAGWCWRIPVLDEDHRGYVHASSHTDEDRAAAELRDKNPGIRNLRVIRFRSGRHRDFWKGNVIAIGNSYGFVEPLQSTALHMVILEIGYLLGALRGSADREADRSFANQSVGSHWDFLRWFLALHYRFNRRLDTPFWRDCQATTDISGMQTLVERFTEDGPWHEEGERHYSVGDPAFSFEGLMLMLLGMRVPCPPPRHTALDQHAWHGRTERYRKLVGKAVRQTEAIEILLAEPDRLHDIVDAPDSWIRRGGESIRHISRETGIVHPSPIEPSQLPPRRYDDLLAPID